jgi:hypothetical protein
VPEGYVWEGKSYSSLSATARAITGTAWSRGGGKRCSSLAINIFQAEFFLDPADGFVEVRWEPARRRLARSIPFERSLLPLINIADGQDRKKHHH